MKSRRILLLLSGALATGLGVVGCDDHKPAQRGADGNLFSDGAYNNDRDRENNSYIQGIGYYHSPYHAWYPFPFNFHTAGRGYYYGGSWHQDAFSGPAPSASRPSAAAWMSARPAFSSLGGSARSFSFSEASGFFSHSSIGRGGFGSSAAGHGGGNS